MKKLHLQNNDAIITNTCREFLMASRKHNWYLAIIHAEKFPKP